MYQQHLDKPIPVRRALALAHDFPFYMVQLASFTAKQTAPVESTWAELREAQTRTLHLQNTGNAQKIANTYISLGLGKRYADGVTLIGWRL